jgi:hypothetical protein
MHSILKHAEETGNKLHSIEKRFIENQSPLKTKPSFGTDSSNDELVK